MSVTDRILVASTSDVEDGRENRVLLKELTWPIAEIWIKRELPIVCYNGLSKRVDISRGVRVLLEALLWKFLKAMGKANKSRLLLMTARASRER